MIRILIVLALLGLGASNNLVTGQAKPVKRCIGYKANGTPCKSTFVMASGFCRAHDPTTPKCGAPASKGPCNMPVKTRGERCRFHQE